MTEKQSNILKAALVLFTEDGYHATSTSKIAKKAGVSEGLIFRHFMNKEGLLKSVLKDVERKMYLHFAPILNEETSKDIIKKTLELPFNIKDEIFEFWKFEFKLTWELEQYSSLRHIAPLRETLIKAFTNLRYKHPKLEAQLILQYLDGISTAILRGRLDNLTEFKQFLLHKYHIE